MLNLILAVFLIPFAFVLGFGQEQIPVPPDPQNIEQCNAQFAAWEATDRVAMLSPSPDPEHPGAFVYKRLTNGELLARHAYVNSCVNLASAQATAAYGSEHCPKGNDLACVEASAKTFARYDYKKGDEIQSIADAQLVERLFKFLNEHKLLAEFVQQKP